MMADLMTKKMKIPFNLEEVIMRNTLHLPQPLVNEVVAVGAEICIRNMRETFGICQNVFEARRSRNTVAYNN